MMKEGIQTLVDTRANKDLGNLVFRAVHAVGLMIESRDYQSVSFVEEEGWDMAQSEYKMWRDLFLADHDINQAEVFFMDALKDEDGKMVYCKLNINQLLTFYEGDRDVERVLKRIICRAVYTNKSVGRELDKFVRNEVELGNHWLIGRIIRLNKR